MESLKELQGRINALDYVLDGGLEYDTLIAVGVDPEEASQDLKQEPL